MDILRLVLLLLHVIGYAALVGGLLAQVRDPEKKVNALMRDGAGTAFVTGLLLVGVLEGLDTDVNHAKVGVKLGIALVVLVLVMANLRKPSIPTGLWAGILVLTVANIVVALFWSPAHEVADDSADVAAPVVVTHPAH